jgi:hypothetical protein
LEQPAPVKQFKSGGVKFSEYPIDVNRVSDDIALTMANNRADDDIWANFKSFRPGEQHHVINSLHNTYIAKSIACADHPPTDRHRKG